MVDIGDDFNMDISEISNAITERTKAIIDFIHSYKANEDPTPQ